MRRLDDQILRDKTLFCPVKVGLDTLYDFGPYSWTRYELTKTGYRATRLPTCAKGIINASLVNYRDQKIFVSGGEDTHQQIASQKRLLKVSSFNLVTQKWS